MEIEKQQELGESGLLESEAKCRVSLPRKGGNQSSRGLVIVRRSTLAQTRALDQASMNQKCVISKF